MPIMDRYEEEFNEISSQIETILNNLTTALQQNGRDEENTSLNLHQLESEKSLAKNLLTQNKDLLKQMALEARSISKQSTSKEDGNEAAKILRVCKARHSNLSDDVDRVVSDLEHASLVSSGSNKRGMRDGNKLEGTKERLLDATNSLHTQNQTLDNARKVLMDTEHTALEITEELSRNREKISSAHGRVRDVGTLSNRARRVLHSMTRRDVQQKMVVYCIGGVLVMVVLYLLFH